MQYYRRIERTFPTGETPSLRVANRRGELVIVGEDRDDIAFAAQLSVEADGEREGESRLDAVKLPMSQEGDHVEIGPPEFDETDSGLTIFGVRVAVLAHLVGAGRVDMQLRVPRRCQVEAEQRAGPMRISGLRADLRAGNRSGRSEVRDHRGALVLESRSGTIEVRDVVGDVRLEARSGRVEIENVEGDVRIASRSGSVTVRQARGRVTAHARSGRLRAEGVDGPLEVATSAGSVEFRGRVAHPVSIEVQSGSVRLAVTRDSAFFLDAETHAGSIRSDLPVDYLERPPAEAPTVRVRSHAGSIRVVPA